MFQSIVGTYSVVNLVKKKSKTNKTECELILPLHIQCQSLRQISKVTSRYYTTVKDIIGRFSMSKNHKNKQRSVCPKKFSNHDNHIVLHKVKKNPKISASKIALKL